MLFQQTFPGFAFPAYRLSNYIYRDVRFVICLTSGEVVRHESINGLLFRQWLTYHHIKDITDEVGAVVLEAFFSV